jgi:hypothetical protein
VEVVAGYDHFASDNSIATFDWPPERRTVEAGEVEDRGEDGVDGEAERSV